MSSSQQTTNEQQQQQQLQQINEQINNNFSSSSILLTAGYDQTIRIWNHQTAACSRVFEHEKSQVNCLAIHPDKKIFAAGGYQRVSFYNISKESNQPIVILNKENSNLNKNIVSIGFQNKGHWIFTAGEDRTIKIWDMMSSHINCLKTFTHTQPISCATLHPNQTHILMGDELGNLIKWDLKSGQSENLMNEPKSAIRSISVNPEGTLMAAVDNDGNCFMWNITGDASSIRILPKNSCQPHKRYALKCTFSPDSTLLATSSADGTAKIFKTVDFSLLKECKQDGTQRWVWDLAFTSDSKHLFTASTDSTDRFLAKKWPVYPVNSMQPLNEYVGHQQPVVCLAFADK